MSLGILFLIFNSSFPGDSPFVNPTSIKRPDSKSLWTVTFYQKLFGNALICLGPNELSGADVSLTRSKGLRSIQHNKPAAGSSAGGRLWNRPQQSRFCSGKDAGWGSRYLQLTAGFPDEVWYYHHVLSEHSLILERSPTNIQV